MQSLVILSQSAIKPNFGTSFQWHSNTPIRSEMPVKRMGPGYAGFG